MKDEELAELIERIRQELGETQRVLERINEGSENLLKNLRKCLSNSKQNF